MKAIALAHDWFNTKAGGGERVALELAALFPKAPLYTLIYNPDKFGQAIASERLRTSWLNKLPRALLNRPRYLLPLIPAAVRRLDFSGYELIITSSVAFIKNLNRPKGAIHICYCHSPMRFAWDYADTYLEEQQLDPFRRLGARWLIRYLRSWDRRGNRNVDVWLANSKAVAGRINRYYDRQATVVYPPVATDRFKPGKQAKSDYYLTMGALTHYKKIDLAVEAFNANGRRLVVLGEGPEQARLRQLAKPNIEFRGFVPEAEKVRLLQRALGLIHPNEEDFGIAPVEAMAAGTPVIAYQKGGVTESVVDKHTGILFPKQTPASLNAAIDAARQTQFKTEVLWRQARKFDRSVFRQQIMKVVNRYVDAA